MTKSDHLDPQIEPYKIIRARRFTDAGALKKSRKRIAFNKKAAAQMLDSAARLLAEAKSLHDRLEAYYIDAMDFKKVDAVCSATLQKYEHILTSYGL